MENVIMTGPTGCIGTALIDLLLSEGYSVCAICRPGSKNIRHLPHHSRLDIVECDIKNLAQLKGRLSKVFDVFFHFGWFGTTGAERNDCRQQLDNIKYTLDAVELAKDLGCSLFIGAGSQAEYGHFCEPVNEESVTKPFSFYGAAKLSAGNMSRVYASQLGIKHIWVRIFSVYGPCDDYRTLVYYIIDKLLNIQPPKLTAGEQIWDYLYSTDAALALKQIALNGKDKAIYCLGSGIARPLKEYIKEIRDIVSPGMSLKFGEKAYSRDQVMYMCADIKSLTHDTGFLPQVDFKEGIMKTFGYIKKEKGIL